MSVQPLEEALELTELDPGYPTCTLSTHASAHKLPCGNPAYWFLTGWDVVCERTLDALVCIPHAVGIERTAVEGRWCRCSSHCGHRMIDVEVRLL
jgi:hypothetical protein